HLKGVAIPSRHGRLLEPAFRARLDALAEGEPEAVATLGALLEIGLSLRLLLAGQCLRVRETDAPTAFFDSEHQYLNFAPGRERFDPVGAVLHGKLGGG